MDNADLHRLTDGWIARAHKAREAPDSDEYFWAFEEVSDLVEEDFEAAWRLILMALSKDQSNVHIENLSAGPLESLLATHGERVIERVEQEAKKDAAFAHLLGGVWQNSMSDDVWKRVQAVWDRRGWD